MDCGTGALQEWKHFNRVGRLGRRKTMQKENDENSRQARGAKGRAADRLFRELEQKILRGDLRDGEPLPPERDIVDQYGVSRTVVREAVLALANRGLVDAQPRFRPVVQSPSMEAALGTMGSVVGRLLTQPGGVHNLFETRILVEAALTRQAAQSATAEHIAEMEDALQKNFESIDDSDQFHKTDVAFHRVLYTIPGNPAFPAIHHAYADWLSPQWSKMPRMPERNQRNFEAHTAIFEAIRDRDADRAEAFLREHLDQAWQQVRATFGDL